MKHISYEQKPRAEKSTSTAWLRRGKRVALASASSDHEVDLAQLQQRSAEYHKPWVYHAGAAAYFQKIAKGRSIGLFLFADHALVGVINLNEPVMGAFKSAYLGYYMDERFAGHGYMSEGLTLAIDHAFGDLGFHRLEANIQPANSSSIALVKRLGFRLEGFSPKYLCIDGAWCDHERWAILTEDWKPGYRVQGIEE